ncbi:proton channel OTOP2-like [Colossoma macropomum]|uniref:proton channel OTOP2-like n=1 Tax=Colossoma macropomum TaxID=42526 RepID=UPI00186543AE|nr:proton channel OTOP2-like [Colossoma macropomum]
MVLDVGKKDEAEGAQQVVTVHTASLSQHSASMAQLSSVMWRDHLCQEFTSYIPLTVLLVGCALLFGIIANGMQVRDRNLQMFLIIVIVLTTAWMVFYKAHTCPQKEAVPCKDMHARPMWLRGGLMLFGFSSLIVVSLKIAYYVGCVDCDVENQLLCSASCVYSGEDFLPLAPCEGLCACSKKRNSYCMFASAMTFVMWRNVGQMVDDHLSHGHCFHLRNAMSRLASGLVVLVVGACAFITYEKDMAAEEQEKGGRGAQCVLYHQHFCHCFNDDGLSD